MQYNPAMLNDAFLLLALNRMLADQPAILARLATHAGKGVRIHLPLAALNALIDADGRLVALPDDAEIATEIRIGPEVMLRLATGDRDALRQAQVAGDGVLASDLSAALRLFDWALALRPYVGDVAAARAAQFIAGLRGWRDRAADSLGRSVAEYAAHEAPILAEKNAVRHFVQEVDALRDDVARFEARLALLETQRDQ